MTPESHILRDLHAGASTAAAIAERQRLPVELVTAILNRLVIEKKLTTRIIAGTLTVYRKP